MLFVGAMFFCPSVIYTNPFVPNLPFAHSQKTSETPYGFRMFSGCREIVHWE